VCVSCYQSPPKPPNVFICGHCGAGKSTVARELELSGYLKVSEGTALRSVISTLGRDYNDRAIQQLVGEGMRAILGQAVWCKALLNSYRNHPLPLALDDLRHPEDADLLRSLGWVGIRVLADAPVREQRLRARDGEHIDFALTDAPSEHLMDDYPHIRYTIHNNADMEWLEEQVREIARELVGGGQGSQQEPN
jgi:dephospho-CoA kinase